MIGIYCFKSKITGQYYVGSSVSIKSRQESHMKMLKRRNHHSWKLQKHYDKYGKDDLVFIVLERVKRNQLEEKESYYIELYDSYKNGFNCTLNTKRPDYISLTKQRDNNLIQSIDRLIDRISKKQFGYGEMVVQTYICEASNYFEALNKANKLLSSFVNENKTKFKRKSKKLSMFTVRPANECWFSESLINQVRSDLSIALMVHTERHKQRSKQ